jgi:hypothetical protein
LDVAKPSTLSDIPPWQLLKPNVDASLSEYKKSETNPVVFKQKLHELKQSKPSTIEIYTDGSKYQGKVAAAAVTKNEIFYAHLPNEASILPLKLRPSSLRLNTFEFLVTNISLSFQTPYPVYSQLKT